MRIKTYDEMFKGVKSKNEGAFVPFIVARDPDFETSLEIIETFVENCADALEIGFPFSDPVADSPIVQIANIRSLAEMTIKKNFEFIKKIIEFTDIPIGVLTYYNLIYKMGLDKYYKSAKEIGVNSVLVVNLPPEKANNALKFSKLHGIQQIFMAAQTTSNERLPMITEICSGFLYVVAVMGVTGAKTEVKNTSIEFIERIKLKSDIPICVGFGISKPEHVKKVVKSGQIGSLLLAQF
jgi:tryptophan synthase alpha chain